MEKDSSKNVGQAAQLQQLFSELQHNEIAQRSDQDELYIEPKQLRKIDVLNLPPRTEVHSKNNNRTHLKLGRPFMRLLIVVFIFIIVIIGAYYLWGEELITIINNL